jgi:hypothetical protein
VYPDFLIIGAQKAGTTWLQRNLQTHPDIWMPPEKELHYFDEKARLEGGLLRRLRGDEPADRRWRRQAKSRFKQSPKKLDLRDVAWDLKYFLGRPDDAWYASLFARGGGKITGETTPDYSILDQESVAHAHRLMPHAKIVFMMRSPLERPWSAMDMGLRIKGHSWETLKEEKVYRRFDRGRSRLMTNYLRTLQNWGAFYPEDRIFVGFLEDVHFFPEELLRRLHDFLGADSSAEHGVMKRKIHSGFQDTMPAKFASYLAGSYHENLKRLSARFGGYASFWLHCAERLIEEPPTGDRLAYPLYESYLWDEWEGAKDLSAQSGLLSTVRAASS